MWKTLQYSSSSSSPWAAYRQVMLHKSHVQKSLAPVVATPTSSSSSISSSISRRSIVTYYSWRCSSSWTDWNTEALWLGTRNKHPFSSSVAKFSTDTKTSHTLDATTTRTQHETHVDWRFCKDRPTLEYAKAMPRNYSAMSHEQILQLCAEGKYEARKEALIRNVMAIDDVEYDVACDKVLEIAQENRKMMHWEYSPYHMGIFAALVSGGLSFPLIFDKQTVLWFNRHFVTTDVPDAADLETIWEVGSWSWGWMEPVIGQASFVLLVLQFARSQAMKLGMKPYGDAMLSWRSKRLVEKYPQYDSMFVEWFAESEAIYGNHKGKD